MTARNQTQVIMGAILVGIWIFHALFLISWLAHDNPIYPWDLGSHQIQALAFHDYLRWDALHIHKIRSVSYYYPPLYYMIGGFFHHFSGRHPDTLAISNLLYLAIIIFAVFKLGEFLYDARTGFWAAVILSFYPGLTAYTRTPFIDICLTSFVILALLVLYKLFCCQLNSNKFSLYAVITGIFLGLGMMVKWTFLFFVAGPLLWLVIIKSARQTDPGQLEKGNRHTGNEAQIMKPSGRYLILSGLVFILDGMILLLITICLWLIKEGDIPFLFPGLGNRNLIYHLFYLLSILGISFRYGVISRYKSGLIERLTISVKNSAVYGLFLIFLFTFLTLYNWYQYSFHILLAVATEHLVLKGVAQLEPEILTLRSLFYYLRTLLNDQLLVHNFLLFIIGSLMIIKQRKTRDFFLVVSFLIPYLIFSFIQNKDTRFTLPYLPVIALISVSWLGRISKTRWLVLLWTVLLSLNLFQYLNSSFGYFGRSSNVIMETAGGQIAFFKNQIQFIGQAVSKSDSIIELVKFIQGDREKTRVSDDAHESRKVLVVANSWFLDQYSMRYWSLERRIPLIISTIDGRSPLVLRESLHSMYLVTKTDGLGEGVDYGYQLEKFLTTPHNLISNRYRLIAKRPLADGSFALIWKKREKREV
ncbi:glycosyltransferase family 39 protein [candidate division CSSED10-310 bacterium]|uniref:Glycosyltransferase family 39 protein n=1 Tax=candidate division CSSED10-310 bacterium TaxID=2855610 RepID=A0ABV6YTE1_UNCC1